MCFLMPTGILFLHKSFFEDILIICEIVIQFQVNTYFQLTTPRSRICYIITVFFKFLCGERKSQLSVVLSKQAKSKQVKKNTDPKVKN